MIKSGVQITLDRTAAVFAGIRELASNRVMVGIPAEKAPRDDDSKINNAEIGYINENGAPEINLPARPHLKPAVKARRAENVKGLRRAALAALDGKPQQTLREYHRLGLANQAAVRNYIRAGLQPPLALRTLEGRAARGRKGAKKEIANRAAGLGPSSELAKPLIDTGDYLRHISYVVRRKTILDTAQRL